MRYFTFGCFLICAYVQTKVPVQGTCLEFEIGEPSAPSILTMAV